MDEKLFDRFPNLPDQMTWPASLLEALDSGNCLVQAHGNNQVILLSTIAGDLIRVQGSGEVQARIAIDLKTGTVARPTPGSRISRWEAEVLGELERYEQRLQQQQDRPLGLSEWDFGGSRPGTPKERQ